MKIYIKLLLLATICLNMRVNCQNDNYVERTPYCGYRGFGVRICQNDSDCRYSDEFCNDVNLCARDLSLYYNDPCHRNKPTQPPTVSGGLQESTNDFLCANIVCCDGQICLDGRCQKINEDNNG
eukprot:403336139